MIDIFIKSFDRPYYLERCIRSIYEYVSGTYRIKILDDGTSEACVAKLKILFPDVEIYYSPERTEKIRAVENHIRGSDYYKITTIPGKFWGNCIKKSGDIFLLLEEDQWFDQPFDLDHFGKIMIDHKMSLIKLVWNGNPNTVTGIKEAISPQAERLIPNLPVTNETLLRLYFNNTLKIRSVFTRLNWNWQYRYYSMYSVAGALFAKTYWLQLWYGADGESVNEYQQLLAAVKMYNKNADIKFGKSTSERIATSFLTSSTNRFIADRSDMIGINYVLNRAWLNDELDSRQGMPGDFDFSYLEKIVVRAGRSDLVKNWKSRIELFLKIHGQISVRQHTRNKG